MKHAFIAAILGLAVAVGTLFTTVVFAGDPAPEVVVVGTNYCLGCTLKSEQGAHAQCSIYGHRHGLLVESAKAGDKSLELKGQTLHYLDNDPSAPLAKGEGTHGQKVEVHGKLYAEEHLLDVSTFKALE